MGGAPASISFKGNGEGAAVRRFFRQVSGRLCPLPADAKHPLKSFWSEVFFEGPAVLCFFRKKERRTRSGWRKKIDYI